MILDWAAQLPVLLAALAIVFVPGALALRGAGVRGLALIGAAPLFTVAATALIAIAFGAIGVPWNPVTWGIAIALVVAIAWLIGGLLGRRLIARERAACRWWLPVTISVGAALGLWRLIAYIIDPAAISQTNDAVFHMNAVRYVLETADASSMHVNAVIGGHSFYPSGWHGLVSLIVQATGTEIAVAANILTLTIGAVIWPVGIAWLTRRVTGSHIAAGFAAIMSSALQTFPLLMFQWGVLFPNALSVALIPAAIALVVSLPEWNAGSGRWAQSARTVLLVLIAAAALALSQPAALLPWAAIVVVWFTSWSVSIAAERGRARAYSLVAAAWVALGAMWWRLAEATSGSHWTPFRSKLEAGIDVLLNGQVLIPFAFGISALMVIGLVVAVLRTHLRWFAIAWAGISLLYVMVASVTWDLIRVGILGAWYADPYRIAALAPIVAVPLAALGAETAVQFIARLLKRPARGGIVPLAAAVLTIGMIVLVALRPTAMPAYLSKSFDRESRYVAAADAFLSPDERTLLESLDDVVEPDARVLGNPSTGSGFGYFLSGVDVYPRTWAPPTTDEWAVLAADLRDAATDPAVCEAIDAYGADYVLDFGPGEASPGRYEMAGMTDFAGQDGFELVAQEGGVSLWRITACAQ